MRKVGDRISRDLHKVWVKSIPCIGVVYNDKSYSWMTNITIFTIDMFRNIVMYTWMFALIKIIFA